jgi:hypothetical protein
MRIFATAVFLFCSASSAHADDIENLNSIAGKVKSVMDVMGPRLFQKHEISDDNLQIYVNSTHSMEVNAPQAVADFACSLSSNLPNLTWEEKHAVEVYVDAEERPRGLCYVGE